MKTRTSILSLLGTILFMVFILGEAQAQRRYKHLKKGRTEEGFVVKPKSHEKPDVTEIKSSPAEPVTVSAERENEVNPASPSEELTETASVENKISAPAKKQSAVKALFKSETTIETANRLFFSNKAMASVGLDRMLSPERTKGNPGLAFLIMGAVFLGVGLTLFITSFFLLFIDDILGFVALLLVGLALMIVGAVFLPIGIVKFVKYKRGR